MDPENLARQPEESSPSDNTTAVPEYERGAMNRNAALARFAGSEQLFADMARFFLEDSPRLLEQIHRQLEANDAQLVTRAAHSLKGLAANFDAHATMNAAQHIEDLARRSEFTQVAQHLPQLIQELERLRSALRPHASQSAPR